MDSSHSYDVGSNNFQQRVLDASQHGPVLVDFWAPWCAPCKVLKPVLEKLAAEFAGRFILAKVNSDENQDLAAEYGVRGIPNVKAFVGGQLVDEFTGALPEPKLREFITGLIPSPAEPLRLEAQAALTRGDTTLARQHLQRALELDDTSENVQLDLAELELKLNQHEAAGKILAALDDAVKDRTRWDALNARLKLAMAAKGLDAAAMEAQLAENPNDLKLRLQLANRLAVDQDYRNAFVHLLEIVKRDRRFEDDAGRKTMLTLFNLLADQPDYDSLVREFRVALARTIN